MEENNFVKMSLESYDPPNVLFLRGCFMEDCLSIEDVFDKRVMDGICGEEPSDTYDIKDIVYEKIPAIFESVNKWPKKTNLKCWTCDCNFHNMPIFVPKSLGLPSTSNEVYSTIDTIGNFCSWNCASSYINMNFFGDKRWEKHQLLRMLYKIFTGKTIEEIIPSPPKTNMVQYGGKLTQKEYQEHIKKLNNIY